METFEFNMHGGIVVTVDKASITITVKGVKGWLFQRIKPRQKKIALQDIIRLDYKTAKLTVGYLRIITAENEPYESSFYVAEHDPNGFIFEKEDMAEFTALMNYLDQLWPTIKKTALKM